MTAIRRYKELYNASAAGNGTWFRLDNRYESNPQPRTIQVELTSSDTVIIQGITKDIKGSLGDVPATATAQDITDITTISADGAYQLYGSWTYIRAVKTGTAANAKVQGFI